MPQPLIELGGDKNAPIISLAPANGFVPQTYIPLLRPLMNDYRIVSTPTRALWGDGEAPELTIEHSWHDLSIDMLNAYEKFGLKDVIAMGHSFGGVMTLLAALQKPELFKAIILLDPVIMPHQICDWVISEHKKGNIAPFPLADLANRRRNSFQSVEEAFQNFHGKSIFKDWSDEVLRLYVEHGTIPSEDGSRRLTWSPAWEAFYYSCYYPYIWDEIPKLKDLDLPIYFIAAENSDAFVAEPVSAVQEILPDVSFTVFEGKEHLFPQAAPKETSQMIQDWLAKNL